MSKFEKIKIGDSAKIIKTISQSDIEKFVDLSGDDNKLHVDKEFAERTSFKKPVVHGMLGASFISTIIGTKLPGDGSLWFSQSLEFLKPVRVGDELTIVAEVIRKEKRTKVIVLSTVIFNQHKQKVTTGTAKVKIIEKTVEPKKTKNRVEKNKVALVIGGTGGIGAEVCKKLASDGFTVLIHYNENKDLASKIKKEIISINGNAAIIQGDVLNSEDVENMFELIKRKYGSITVVVNAFGETVHDINFKDINWDIILRAFEFNIKGVYNIIKNAVEMMEPNKYGKIINLSTLAIEKPNAGWLHYITAKSALTGFSKALAFELAPKGIRINMVSPGMTETQMISDIPEKVKLVTALQTPLRRIANPEDIACAISFLASPDSDYITGETIRVNGGQVML